MADFVRDAAETFGGIDCVDHNAAWSHPRLDRDATGVEIGVWDRTIEITTRGALLLARHAIPVMAERGGGSIVTISSGTSSIGESVRVAYGVSKAALNQLTRHLAVRYGREGIRANAIAPGLHHDGHRGGQRPRGRAATAVHANPCAVWARPTTSHGWWSSSAVMPRVTSTGRCSTSTAATRSPG